MSITVEPIEIGESLAEVSLWSPDGNFARVDEFLQERGCLTSGEVECFSDVRSNHWVIPGMKKVENSHSVGGPHSGCLLDEMPEGVGSLNGAYGVSE